MTNKNEKKEIPDGRKKVSKGSEMGKYRDGIFHGSLCCVVLLWLGILDGAKQRKVESCTGIDLGRF